MFTHQFFDLLLNLNENWQVKEIEAYYRISDINITIDYLGKQA